MLVQKEIIPVKMKRQMDGGREGLKEEEEKRDGRVKREEDKVKLGKLVFCVNYGGALLNILQILGKYQIISTPKIIKQMFYL